MDIFLSVLKKVSKIQASALPNAPPPQVRLNERPSLARRNPIIFSTHQGDP